jgi:DNA-binding transcriptional LysR family regulator
VRDAAAPLERFAKEPHGGLAVAAGLEQDVDDIAVLVDGPPEALTLTANGHEEFVQMPRVANGPGPMPEPPWSPPFPGFFLYYPSRKHQPAAIAALIETFRV